ncbi:MAG: leucine--tRNA ligase [Actinomycetota bacterium]|nr:leucine--tRNA ligase [Actinomycetota bacterium]MDA2970655.1 leucine--tRNA ligase [Actinomycetota bacterium]MDA3000317.1 leucine--tRNA ligase [Actinomycetota bacterium]
MSSGPSPDSSRGPSDDSPRHRYNADLAREIETRWQDQWDADGTFEAPNPAGPLAEPDKVAGRPKLFVLDMFPYPSGAGLHVGHPLGYIGTDVYGRFQRMMGFNVLHALGYDSFGLPAEQHAITTGVHPRVNTESNVANMRRQLRRLGLAHDARRSVSTTDEDFYRWTQWIFRQVFESWYDDEERRARPISELIAQFESGARITPEGRPWSQLSTSERDDLVDSHRLAYLSEAPVNWCPGLGTILANEEVTADGRSDIGNYPVFKKNMRQWMMRITAYADRLLEDLDRLDWPEPIKLMQRNWIGRSEGARVDFSSPAGPITVFTTRPDTLFGATFMVLAPEHPLVERLTTEERRAEVDEYRSMAAATKDLERQAEGRDKTGVFTGSFAINPVNGSPVPIWIADYVLMGYGTGAIMAVPCGDQRDFEFARKFGLDIPAIQQPPAAWFDERGITAQIGGTIDTDQWPEAYVGDGIYVNSSSESLSLDGIDSVAEGKRVINDWLEAHGHGEATINYKLRDWLFSRQRYWGEPFPIVYDESGRPVALPESMLPVLLPELDDFKPQALDPDDDVTDPIPPLARASDWVNVELDLGDGPKRYRREINVMPQWAGSCWYELRYLDPTNRDAFVDPAVEKYWMGPADGGDGRTGHTGGVDLYVGGVEHAVLHLLYARFWHKILFDLGHVSSSEPFHRLFNQGYIQAYAYRDPRGQPVPAADVDERDGSYFYDDEPVVREYGKMGKSLKNIVTPDEMYDEFGADTFRLYEMSMGPLEASRPWNTRDVVGMQRFLQRVWRNLVDEDSGSFRVDDSVATDELRRLLHRTIDGVRADMAGLRFNTAIAKLIELNNALTQEVTRTGSCPREVATPLVQMLSPLCPHLGEELWRRLGHSSTITYEAFPEADPSLLVDDMIEYPVQINGKVRTRVEVPADADRDTVQALALADDKVIAALAGSTPKKVIVVPGRMVNLVV